MEIGSPWFKLLFDVRRSVRYHQRRMQFFDTLGKWNSFISIVLGSGAAAFFLSPDSHKNMAALAALMVVMVQTIDLLVGSSKTARTHADLARRFVGLESEMVAAPETTEGLTAFTVKRLNIEADEPQIMRMLDAICYNELAKALGCEPGYQVKIPWLKRRLAQFVDFDTDPLKPAAV